MRPVSFKTSKTKFIVVVIKTSAIVDDADTSTALVASVLNLVFAQKGAGLLQLLSKKNIGLLFLVTRTPKLFTDAEKKRKKSGKNVYFQKQIILLLLWLYIFIIKYGGLRVTVAYAT